MASYETLSITDLPPMVLLDIFQYLGQEDLLSVQSISSTWHQLAFHQTFWKTLDTREYSNDFVTGGSFAKLFQKVMSSVECLHFDVTLFEISHLTKRGIICPNLREVHMYDESHDLNLIQNEDKNRVRRLEAGLVRMSRMFRSLTGLFFHNFAVNVYATFPDLKEFGCGDDCRHSFEIVSFNKFLKRHASLTSLHINSTLDFENFDNIASILCDLPCLEELEIQDLSLDLHDGASLQDKQLRLDNLKKLSFKYGYDLTDSFLELCLRNAHNLTYLELSFCDGSVTDASFEYVGRHCLNLETLIIQCDNPYIDIFDEYIVHITEEGFKKIVTNCLRLKEVNLNGAFKELTTDTTLQTLVTSCTQITTLEIAMNMAITDKTILLVIRNCPSLRRMNISHCKKLTNVSISAVFKYCRQLESLILEGYKSLSDIQINEDVGFGKQKENRKVEAPGDKGEGEPTAKRQKVSSAAIDETAVFLEGLQGVSESGLRLLSLVGCTSITDSCMLKLAKFCPYLRHLSLSGCNSLTDRAVAVIVMECRYLNYLNISGTDSSNIYISQQDFEEALNISVGTRITNRSLSDIAKYGQRIEHLSITNNINITIRGVQKVIQNCPFIQLLVLSVKNGFNHTFCQSRIDRDQIQRMLGRLNCQTFLKERTYEISEIQVRKNVLSWN